MARLAITVNTDRGTHTEHFGGTYVEIRNIVANFVNRNGLRRDAYTDCETLFRGDAPVGHYVISRYYTQARAW